MDKQQPLSPIIGTPPDLWIRQKDVHFMQDVNMP